MNEKLISIMQDARLVAAADNVIYPMLESKIIGRLEVACAKYRGGETNFISDIAYITGLQDILHELKTMQNRGLTAFEKLNRGERI